MRVVERDDLETGEKVIELRTTCREVTCWELARVAIKQGTEWMAAGEVQDSSQHTAHFPTPEKAK